ncbi:hypothetical protein CcaverHIS002_0404520 [Cutaneotrichosporon cavernicola]|uniref:Cytoplasmic protein n=1 Tax=Cutaneotrichosporon cavernicola TaxID=279322 RepID=A0AA48L451_9TREE|nr:uncharacterized protein CcaverHIS019_0404490 [Cutaneotrichosporon cavernicola]BEI83848.1 hypothetical protein CcaverHIS002_0404520 [Cutaneotrichosporon cavernicola]BEI91629.1 hypothetical protein CcaverHIS019_0404490 [Cutaneotrichosporon cavernicola]BEI99405.1 hypothetical protein CcaverHIS631_0404480 [Cutaneotrichosporon cavernicola]BEJ07182.1 hypothetical protein CcaverHIS641_0404510 [Cutaneotrichosporon cavernicola]
MQAWKNFSAALPAVDVSNVSKNFRNTVQATRERLGSVDPESITELPAEYKALESRVDALKDVHQKLLKITKVYETESYDYPSDLAENLSEVGHQAQAAWASFAAKNLKNSPLPVPAEKAPVEHLPKTLPHALSRAAAAGAGQLTSEDRLGAALGTYAVAEQKIGEARLMQDQMIVERFVNPWQATLSTSIGLAMKARANVKTARLELDSARGVLKTAGPTKQEQARLHVEEAEDKLVQATETAIGLMKAVLENPEPLQNLSALVKAQLIYFSTAAEALSGIESQIDEAAAAAEAEYRTSRGA